MNTNELLTATVDMDVVERIFGDHSRGEVHIYGIERAALLMGLAYRKGELDDLTYEVFSDCVRDAIGARIKASPEGRAEVAAWIKMEEAERRLPRTAVPEMVN